MQYFKAVGLHVQKKKVKDYKIYKSTTPPWCSAPGGPTDMILAILLRSMS